MTDLAKIFEGVATLLWPCIAILLVFWFKPAVAALIESAKSRKFTLKIGGQELTMEEANAQQSSLIADLQSRVLEIQKKTGLGGTAAVAVLESPQNTRTIQRASILGVDDQPKNNSYFVQQPSDSGEATGEVLESPPHKRTIPRASILWVDDQPKHNSYFVQQLSDRGVKIDLALSTAEGLKQFDRGQYSLLLSDMGRIEEGVYNRTAGLELLKKIRAHNPNIPFVIFCSSRGVREHASDAKALGVTSITSSSTQLMGILETELDTIGA